MKQIVILSGKGGTGKTTMAAALAHLASRQSQIVMVDADVDAANLELVLAPRTVETHDFLGGKVAIVDSGRCIGSATCAICAETCRFEAVLSDGGVMMVDPIACEGCAACIYQCPASAISMKEQTAGRWSVSETRFGPLVHAHLFAAQENSGKLVTQVKERGRKIALEEGRDYLLIDGPPGIGCPVIAACSGADLALLVAEPTVAGVHDLDRMLATTDHFRVPGLVVINKHDINPTRAMEIEAYCESRGVPVIGRLPFDTAATASMVRGQAITEMGDGRLCQAANALWERLRAQAGSLAPTR